MIILVSGTRERLNNLAVAYVRGHILEALAEEGPPRDGLHVIVHGAASGVDTIAAQVGDDWEDCEARAFPADWDQYGKSAGPIRNQQMLDENDVDLVLAFPIKTSRGTWDMVERAVKARIAVRVYPL